MLRSALTPSTGVPVAPPDRPALRARLLLAALVGLVAFLACFSMWAAAGNAGDLSWVYRGVGLLARGENPYQDPAPYLDLPLFYPLPALLLVWPLAPFAPPVAAGLFSGISAGLLVFGVTRDGWARLPIVLAGPFWIAVLFAQWSIVITAAATLPWLLPVVLAKPTIGLPILLSRRPSPLAVGVGALLVALSFALLPAWPLDWLAQRGAHVSYAPLLSLPGIVLLLALVHWRDPSARLLLLLAAVPQRWYDPLALWLLPATMRQSLILSIASWAVVGPWIVGTWTGAPSLDQPSVWAVVGAIYLPALLIVLWPALRAWRERDTRAAGA